MAHINKAYSGLNRPQNISFDKIDPQKMFVDNIEILENLYINNIKTIILPTSSIATLRAINTSDIDIFTDGKLINVIGIGIFYFVRANTDVDDNINIVITSYSIHYTKLYEIPLGGSVQPGAGSGHRSRLSRRGSAPGIRQGGAFLLYVRAQVLLHEDQSGSARH